MAHKEITVSFGNLENFEFLKYSHGKNILENGLNYLHGKVQIHVEIFCPSFIPFIADIL